MKIDRRLGVVSLLILSIAMAPVFAVAQEGDGLQIEAKPLPGQLDVLQGTAFQRRVWEALTRIPAGQTLTYGELAARLDSGARAVGNACRHNPVSIIVPCHRVVSATGIGGYSGSTGGREIDRKQWLLGREGIAGPALKIRQKSPTSEIQPDKQRNLHA